MQYTEIIKLLDAGYTKEEIMKMAEPEPNTADPAPADPAPADPAPTDPAGQSSDQTINVALEELKSLFSDMKKEFTAMNIMNSRQEDDVKTGDDVIASIINPPKKNKKDGK